MKKYLVIIFYISIILPFNLSNTFANEITYEWFKTQTESTTANDLVWEKDFENFLKRNITSKKIYLGMHRNNEKAPIIESYLMVLGGGPNEIIYKDNRKYIFTSACRHQSCDEKGVLFIDTEKKQTIGLIRHSFINDTKYSSKMDFLIFSKNHKTFEEIPIIFIEMVKEWVTTSHSNEPPSKVRFIGSDDKIVEITNKY